MGKTLNYFFLQKHPGTKIYNVDRFESWSSLENMWHQVLEVGMDVANISAMHPEGINLIGKQTFCLINIPKARKKGKKKLRCSPGAWRLLWHPRVLN